MNAEQIFQHERAFDFWIEDRQHRVTDIIDATSAGDAASGRSARRTGGFTYMASSPRPESERALLQNDAWLVRHAQSIADALGEHVPGAREKIDEMRVMAWGHSLVIPFVGSHSEFHPAISRAHGRIFFAGADNDIAPGHENAVDAGFAAAREAMRR